MYYTNFKYTSRQDKPEYVWRKYRGILKGKILDVGADECGLKKFLPQGTQYVGVGLAGSVDLKLDLEKQRLPFQDNYFDCVLCLDTLEHLDNIHEVFDELCRVTSKYLIVSLPNPWASFIGMLWGGYNKKNQDLPMKFYNLPVTPPKDRHKWFYGVHEAIRFINERGKMNGMQVVQIDRERMGPNLKRFLFRIVMKLFVHRDVNIDSLRGGNVWAVLVTTQGLRSIFGEQESLHEM